MGVNPKKHTSALFSFLPAVLLSVWYLFAVSGIDIHRDAEHGQVFVVPGIVGCDCDLIHPGQHCSDSAEDAECLDGEDCCSDYFTAVLALGEDPDTGEGFLPLPVSIPFSAPHIDPASVEIASCLPGGRGNAPPPREHSASFSKLSVLRI